MSGTCHEAGVWDHDFVMLGVLDGMDVEQCRNCGVERREPVGASTATGESIDVGKAAFAARFLKVAEWDAGPS